MHFSQLCEIIKTWLSALKCLLGPLLRPRLLVFWVMLCGYRKYLKLRFWVASASCCSALLEKNHPRNLALINKLFCQPHKGGYGTGTNITHDKEFQVLMVSLWSCRHCSLEVGGLMQSPTVDHTQHSRFVWPLFLMESPPTSAGQSRAKGCSTTWSPDSAYCPSCNW